MSKPLRVVHIEPVPDWIRGIYDSLLQAPDYDLVWASDLERDDLVAALNQTDVLVTGRRRVDRELIAAAGPSLRLVQAVGRAPWAVDLPSARDAGVPVSSLPHRGAIAVAEHTFALILGVFRRLVGGHVGTVEAGYRKLDIEPIRTSERKIAFNWLGFPDIQQLYGKTIGLVGLGDIGLEVARRAAAFDMNVLYTKRAPLPADYDAMARVKHAQLNELLEASDVVSIHAPHTPDTEGLIDAAALARMRETAVLVNTARGGLVDEGALVDALQSGSIAAAGLDVFVEEPLPAGHALLNLENVLLSPHTGGGTGGGQKGVAADVKSNIERVRNGEPPLHAIAP